MRVGAEEKAGKLYLKMEKLLAMANPTNTLGFMEEVSFA